MYNSYYILHVYNGFDSKLIPNKSVVILFPNGIVGKIV